MKTMKNIETLVADSIRIYEGMMVRLPQFGKEYRLHIADLTPKFPGTYCTNNSTVAFVWEEMLYVTPYTQEVMTILSEAGFKKDSFGVPFSNWDYPVYEKDQWDNLLKKAEEQRELEFQEDCRTYCSKRGIGAISDDALANCFLIPKSGVCTTHPHHGYSSTVWPAIHGCLDCNACDIIGQYDTNNGRVVFVYYDGSTYVTKGYGILKELEEAGYRKSKKGFFVPFSNGEVIDDPTQRSKWEAVVKR